MRIGMGYDVHRLAADRTLVLGGVTVPYKKGLLGHSDADVLAHAIMDALLGAAGAGDIGRHFPDTDSQYKDISSMILLVRVKDLLTEKGLKVVNIDSVIVAQEPRLAAYMENMAANVAAALEIGPSQVNIKATTTEGLGFTGAGDGIAAYAIAMIE